MSLFSIFWTFAIKSAAPSGTSATPMMYYCTCRCVIFVMRAGIATSGRALSGASARIIILRHCASRGWRGWWGGGTPIRVWSSSEMPLPKTLVPSNS
jgi:hypothetical protein